MGKNYLKKHQVGPDGNVKAELDMFGDMSGGAGWWLWWFPYT